MEGISFNYFRPGPGGLLHGDEEGMIDPGLKCVNNKTCLFVLSPDRNFYCCSHHIFRQSFHLLNTMLQKRYVSLKV